MAKNLKKYLLPLFMGIFLLSGSAMPEETDPEEIVFTRLVKKVLKSQKPSINARAKIDLLREVIKIGSSVSLVLLASKTATVNPSTWSEKKAQGIDFSKSYALKACFALVILTLATVLPIFCDALIYKSDPTLTALNNLSDYVKALAHEQRYKIAKLVKNKKYASQIEYKISYENDGRDIKTMRLLVSLFDIMLPILPILLFAAKNGWNLEKIGKKASNQLWAGIWVDDPLNNAFVLICCAVLAACNILPTLTNLVHSTDCQKLAAWQRIVKKLKLQDA